jgi:hypothetical protein
VQTVPYVQGDRKPNLRATLRDEVTDSVVDVSNPTVRLHVRRIGSTTSTVSITATKPNGGTDGLVDFAWPDGIFAEVGEYEGEIELEHAGGLKQTVVEKFAFPVREQIG